jgi:hypothetical protein
MGIPPLFWSPPALEASYSTCFPRMRKEMFGAVLQAIVQWFYASFGHSQRGKGASPREEPFYGLLRCIVQYQRVKVWGLARCPREVVDCQSLHLQRPEMSEQSPIQDYGAKSGSDAPAGPAWLRAFRTNNSRIMLLYLDIP